VEIQPKSLYDDYQYPLVVSRQANPLVTQMAAAVSKQNLQNNVQTLQDFKTRYAITGRLQAGWHFFIQYAFANGYPGGI